MNKISLFGEVVSEPIFSHEVLGEKFFYFYIKTERTSGTGDTIKCVASELYIGEVKTGNKLSFDGEIRTYNVRETEEKTRLDLFVFVTNNPEVVAEDKEIYVTNTAVIEGFICKKKDCRQTPNGREIADLLVAVNRSYGKSDYIPCICWGRNAHRCNSFNVGDVVRLEGRLQSRDYQKKIDENKYETRTTYEFSAKSIEIILVEE